MKTNFSNLKSLIVVLTTGLLLTACSKSKSTTDDLIGTWKSGTYTITSTVNNMPLAQYLANVLGYPDALVQTLTNNINSSVQQALPGSIQLKSDNTYVATSTGGTDTGIWSLSSDSKKITIASSKSNPITFDIISLSSSDLHVQWSQTSLIDLNNDGTDESVVSTINVTLTK
jgi:hypothetical protein